jgi:hypothetical protein
VYELGGYSLPQTTPMWLEKTAKHLETEHARQLRPLLVPTQPGRDALERAAQANDRNANSDTLKGPTDLSFVVCAGPVPGLVGKEMNHLAAAVTCWAAPRAVNRYPLSAAAPI